MPKFKIEYGIMRYEDEEILEARNKEDAVNEAYDAALAMLESYGGLHGYPYYGECIECDGSGVDEYEEECYSCDGTGDKSWEEFVEEAESWIVYKATEIC